MSSRSSRETPETDSHLLICDFMTFITFFHHFITYFEYTNNSYTDSVTQITMRDWTSLVYSIKNEFRFWINELVENHCPRVCSSSIIDINTRCDIVASLPNFTLIFIIDSEINTFHKRFFLISQYSTNNIQTNKIRKKLEKSMSGGQAYTDSI